MDVTQPPKAKKPYNMASLRAPADEFKQLVLEHGVEEEEEERRKKRAPAAGRRRRPGGRAAGRAAGRRGRGRPRADFIEGLSEGIALRLWRRRLP